MVKSPASGASRENCRANSCRLTPSGPLTRPAVFADRIGPQLNASPIPASSGRTIRHRLNRGGDRHVNRALHDILLTRWRTCQRTRAYIARRRADGKTDPEIRRCLKRYIARELYRCLNTAMTP
jgi:hypothetical protein